MKKIIIPLTIVLIVVLALTVFVACDKINNEIDRLNNKDPLPTPTGITYDGKVLSWDAIEKADHYLVTITDGGSSVERPISGTQFSYVPRNTDFSVSIKATSSLYPESQAAVKSFSGLDKATNLAYDEDAVLTWDPVAGATAYLVSVNNGDETTVYFPNFEVDTTTAGSVAVRVRPIVEGDDSFYSLWADAPKITVLEAPKNIRYEDGRISWRGVERALGYQVSIDGYVVAEQLNGTSLDYDSQSHDFLVRITALGNKTTIFPQSASQEFIYLETVTEMVMDSGVLSWEPIEKATGYNIKVNGSVVERNRKDANFTLSAGTDYTISVMPVLDNGQYFSRWSADRSYYILRAPTIRWNASLQPDGEATNNVVWDAVSEAAGYTARIVKPSGDVEERSYGELERAFAEAYLEVGRYKVAVRANAPTGQSAKYDSVFSNEISVERLAPPSALGSNFITSNPTSLTEGFTVTYNTVAGASQYQIYRDGNKLEGYSSRNNQIHVAGLVDNSVIEPQTLNFTVKSIGSVNNGKNIEVKLDSLTSSDLSFVIYVLGQPTGRTMNGYYLEWDNVSDANGYGVSVSGKANVLTTTESFYDLKGLESGHYDVSVCAKGNGSNTLASNYTAPIEINRLYAPTNVRISIDEASEGSLLWDTVNYATGYQVILDNDDTPVPVGEIGNMNQVVRTTGTQVCMISVANYYNDQGTVYYMTSPYSRTVTFVKLNTPTFPSPSFSNTELLWNAPNNINAAEYTPTYEVYLGTATMNGEKNGTSMSLSTLEGGRDYRFRVKAIGDGTHYVNSDKSDEVSIYKLGTPDVRIEDDQYVWDGVVSASGYSVYVDGEVQSNLIHQSGNTYSFAYAFKELKTYQVKVYAIGDQGYSTIDSKAYTIEQEVRQLSTPEFSYRYIDGDTGEAITAYSVKGEVEVTITTSSTNAKGYCYVVGGSSHNSAEETFSINPNTSGSISVRVYALGGGFDQDGVYYVDSQSAGNSSTVLTVLRTPNQSSIQYNADGRIWWGNVTDAQGYEYCIAWDGEEYGDVQTVSQASVTVSGITSHTRLKIKVRAKGNGNKIISSGWVEAEFDLTL